jgi:hypothetical protein
VVPLIKSGFVDWIVSTGANLYHDAHFAIGKSLHRGSPFIDDRLVRHARNALQAAGLDLVEHDVVIASKREAQECLNKFKKMDDIDAVVLFSGTWVWAAHLVAALRNFASTGKGILLWTNPGSQGWRPVGGLVMHGAMKEIGLPHRFVYGGYDDPKEIARVAAYCRASAMKNRLNTNGALIWKGCLHLGLDPIKNGEDQLSQPFGKRIDEGVSSHD